VTSSYRWVILAVGAFGAGTFAMLRMGLPSLGPELRDTYDLSLAQVGLVFSCLAGGVTVGLLPWGMLTDRIGERPVLAGGLTAFSAALLGVTFAPTYTTFCLLMVLAGLLGGSATGASGRAVMGWFSRAERGTALGIRQMALPLGGGLASLVLPLLAGAGGLDLALRAVAGVALVAALAGALLMRDAPAPPGGPAAAGTGTERPMRDRRQWRLGVASGMLIWGQIALLGFVVLFLVDERGVPVAVAAACLAALQVLGAVARLVAGRASDRQGARVPLLRRIALLDCALLRLVALLAAAGRWADPLLYVALVAAGTVAMCWNGLAFTAAAEIAGRRKAGTAMGLQNTLVSVGGLAAPTAFGALVGATSWPFAYAVIAAAPIAAYVVLAPLEADEARRADDRLARLATTPT
jgi:sugar phosphate permease